MKGNGVRPDSGQAQGATASDLTGKALERANDNAMRVTDRDAEFLDQLRPGSASFDG
jgi:hypothetical protein